MIGAATASSGVVKSAAAIKPTTLRDISAGQRVAPGCFRAIGCNELGISATCYRVSTQNRRHKERHEGEECAASFVPALQIDGLGLVRTIWGQKCKIFRQAISQEGSELLGRLAAGLAREPLARRLAMLGIAGVCVDMGLFRRGDGRVICQRIDDLADEYRRDF
jgi:hypothetical protein